MSEFVAIIVFLVVVTGMLLPVARQIEPIVSWIERGLTWVSMALILFVMGFVCLEVLMRYAFNSPIPGHLEGSELIMPMIVFFALAYTQSVNSHVGMTLVVDSLRADRRRVLEIGTLTLSLFIYSVLAYYSGTQAHRAWIYDDVTMTPPYFKVWPSAAAVPLGFTVCSLRMYLQLLMRISPARFGYEEKHASSAFGDE